MKISKETWKDILKIVGTIIATIASVLACRRCHCRRLKSQQGNGRGLENKYYKTKKVCGKPKYLLQAHLFKKYINFIEYEK